MKISQSISENFTWQRWCSPVKSPYLDYNAAHCIWFCRTTAFRQDGGFGGRGSGLFGGSLLWPLVSGDQPAEQPGGAGVVCWPLWGAQEEEFLHWGEEAAGKDHAGVSGRSQEGDIHVAYDDRKEPNVSYGNVMYYSSVYFFIFSVTICRNLTTSWPPSLLLWSVMEEKEQRAWWAFSMSFSTNWPTAESLT